MKTLKELFFTFFKIGLFTFGGGYAMISLIEKEVCENKKWLTTEEMMDIIAIAEATPGPIAINTATFIGYKRAKIKGSVIATFGVVLPSFVIIAVLSYFYKEFNENLWVTYMFKGIRIGVCVLILNAFITFLSKWEKNIINIFIMLLAFFVSAFTNISVVYVIISAGIIGFLNPTREVKKL